MGSVIGGRYRLETELESDDRGRNFQAMDQQHAGQPAAVCQVAMHCMQPGPADFETALAERRAEFQLAQPLSHPNVLSVRELDQDGVYIYLTMNLMRGETLAALLDRRQGKALARSAAFAIIRDIGAALTYTHDHGVVHGNLQPQGILISPAGELRVRGFGAQRASSCYASGEQLENRPPDRRDDLYALACISYELLHGSHPFDRQNASTARGRGMTPARPIQLTGQQWRALRMGLAWRREGRNLSVARWIGRMHVGSASKRLPMLEDLMAMPPPRRSWWRPVLVIGCLAAAAAFALSLYRSPGMTDVARDWNRLRAAVIERVHPAAPVSAPAETSTPPVATLPPPEAAPADQQAATPVPGSRIGCRATRNRSRSRAAHDGSRTGSAARPRRLPSRPSYPHRSPPRPRWHSHPHHRLSRPRRHSPHPRPRRQSLPLRAQVCKASPLRRARPPRLQQPSRESNCRPTTTRCNRATRPRTYSYAAVAAHAERSALSGGRKTPAPRPIWTLWPGVGASSASPPVQGSVTLLVPIIKDATRNAARNFYVIIDEDGDSAKVGGITRATVLLPGSG